MGNCLNRAEEEAEPAPKVYSWDKRRQEQSVDRSKFIVADKDGETIVRNPGDIDGQQFVVRNCKNCNIYVFDHTATVTIDDCYHCRIFLGPVKGSVFIRDCSHLHCAIVCQQFRTRDCQKIVCLISCATQPIIEASSGMKFGCLQLYYKQLEDQFEKANLSLYNNNWATIHDYTMTSSDIMHWSVLPETTAFEDVVPLPTDTLGVGELEVDTTRAKSVIPLTLGSDAKESDEVCLVVFFESQNHRKRVHDFLHNASDKMQVIQIKEVTMTAEDCKRVFNTRQNQYNQVVEKGPVVGVELCGNKCIPLCEELLLSSQTATSGTVYMSESAEMASKDVDMFYHFVSMMMSA